MKTKFLYILGFVFLISCLVYFTNNNLRTFGFSKTNTINGVIIGQTYNPQIDGVWSDKIWYEYKVNGELHTDTAYIENNEAILTIDSEVEIIYQVDNPTISKLKN